MAAKRRRLFLSVSKKNIKNFDCQQEIIEAEKLGITNDIKLSRHNLSVDRGANAAQLNRLRRHFLAYSKMLHVEVNQIPLLFVKYLNTNM